MNSDLKVKAAVELGTLQPDDVDVQIYFGKLNPYRKIVKGQSRSMVSERSKSKKSHYTGTISSPTSGLHGFTLRIVPRCSDQVNPFEWHLVHWQN